MPSALYAHLGQDRVATAAALGRISSSAALLDILVASGRRRAEPTPQARLGSGSAPVLGDAAARPAVGHDRPQAAPRWRARPRPPLPRRGRLAPDDSRAGARLALGEMGERWGRFGRLARGSSPGGEGSLTTLSRRRLAGAASREQVIVKLLSLLLTSTYVSPYLPR